jgi:Leucine-rich repeat (LRR) protein
MIPTPDSDAYRQIEAAHAAAVQCMKEAQLPGDLNALRSSTEELKRTTAEFRKALEHELTEIPGKGRLIRAEHQVLQQLARENQVDSCWVLDGIDRIEGGRVRELNLAARGLTSITALVRLTGLTRLDLRSNQLTEITSLEKLTGLTKLDLAFNHLDNITPLPNLTGLTELALTGNHLEDITPLAKHTTLRRLELYCNPLTNPGNDKVLAALHATGCRIWM